MKIDRSGITNALKDAETKIDAASRYNFVPMLTIDERSRFCKLTGFDSFALYSAEAGLLAGAHNATTTKRGTGIDQPFAIERLYAFRKSVRDVIAQHTAQVAA